MSGGDRKPRILIADQDDVMLIGVSELLRRRGFEVCVTDRLELGSESGQFDIIIFDPMIEGDFDAGRHFLEFARTFSPPPLLIVVSEFIESIGDIGEYDEQRALLHVKPVRIAALTESVEWLLRNSTTGVLAAVTEDSN